MMFYVQYITATRVRSIPEIILLCSSCALRFDGRTANSSDASQPLRSIDRPDRPVRNPVDPTSILYRIIINILLFDHTIQ